MWKILFIDLQTSLNQNRFDTSCCLDHAHYLADQLQCKSYQPQKLYEPLHEYFAGHPHSSYKYQLGSSHDRCLPGNLNDFAEYQIYPAIPGTAALVYLVQDQIQMHVKSRQIPDKT